MSGATRNASIATDRAMRLAAYVAGWSGRAFDWRTANCCHFVAGWVREIADRDPMAGLPATLGHRDARRLVLTLGGSLVDAWSNRLGYQPIAPGLAQLGDVVLMPVAQHGAYAAGGEPGHELDHEGGLGSAVGICGGRHAALLTRSDGVAWVPADRAVWAWRVPSAGGEA